MTAGTLGSLGQHTQAELTDVESEDVQARAAEILLGLADGRGLRALPRLRGDLLMYLCTDAGRRLAAVAVVARWGYVSMHPRPFVALQLARESWPCGY